MKLAVVIVGLLIAAALAWNAAERHYDNCVAAAKADNPPAPTFTGSLDESGDPDTISRLTYLDERPGRRREAAVEGCSRLPW